MEERIIKDINNLLTQLFQKIKEAGYVWYAEKKELMKIEQNSAWSEEDDIRLDHLIGLIQKYGLNYYESIDKVIDIIHWIKSLKPHWKPSEEQMEALNAINNVGELSYAGQADLLIRLYNNLKKL